MHNHAPEGYLCPFCLIIQSAENERISTLQNDVIYRTAWVTAVIGSHQWPNNPGNTLIIPNEHFENIYDLPTHYGEKIQAAAHRLALAMKQAYHCAGVSLRQHNEPAGNQDVWRYHAHITPRYENDGLYASLLSHRALMPPEERTQYAARLRAALSGGSQEVSQQ